MDKHDAVYPYNGIIFGSNKELRTAIDELWKHHARWKKLETKAMCYMITAIWTVQNRQIHRDRK